MLDRGTRAHLERELMQLRRLLRDYAELLATSGVAEEPGLIPRTALSTVLQSFYQGVESVFDTWPHGSTGGCRPAPIGTAN